MRASQVADSHWSDVPNIAVVPGPEAGSLFQSRASPDLGDSDSGSSSFHTPLNTPSRSPTLSVSSSNPLETGEISHLEVGSMPYGRSPSDEPSDSFMSARSRILQTDDDKSIASSCVEDDTLDLLERCTLQASTRIRRERSISLGISKSSPEPLPTITATLASCMDGEFDMSDKEDGPAFLLKDNRPGQELPAYQAWALDGIWIYCALGKRIDQRFLLPGVVPFYRPLEWLPQEGTISARTLRPNASPFLVQGTVSGDTPKLQYDPQWDRILITPHSEPWHDLRKRKDHPDWLPEQKLLQYQSVEIAGWSVWRHDRNALPCSRPGCNVNTRDHDVATQICLGCGPCSSIRYCSKEDMTADLSGHYQECGHKDTLIPSFIDQDTRPARFSRRYPFVTDISEIISLEKHRQRHYYIINKGQYTVFLHKIDPITVRWPTRRLQQLYGPRVERLMNAAFFDQTRENIVGCLFYHVRMALRLTAKWTDEVAAAVKLQFEKEFNWYADGAYPEDLCECVWLGDEADERLCTTTCAHASMVAGGVRRGRGLKALLEALESNHFLLRVWQRQHPTIRSWKARLSGKGFPGARVRDLSKERPLFGKGWDGIGAAHTFGGWEHIF